MGKFNQLLGLANNFAASFVSVTNSDFLEDIAPLPIEISKLFEIDLLKETIIPKELNSDKLKKVIQNYKRWFLSELKKLKIELDNIEKVSIRVTYKPGKTFARYYTCNVTIRAKGKEYTMEAGSSYS